MKLLVVLGFILGSSAAFATPTVGDTATFAFTAVQGGVTYTGTDTWQLTAFDATAQSYSWLTTVVVNGSTQTNTQATPANQLLTDATIQSVLANCTADGGTSSVLITAVGTINACALPNNQNGTTGTIWVAAVPFGVAQFSLTDTATGNTQSGTIQSYTAGTGN